MMNQQNAIKHTNILAVFANPKGSDPLRLGAEDRIIHECLDRSTFRDNITLEILHAATIHDIRRKLLTGDYHIIQFSGHGMRQGLVLEDTRGEPRPVPKDALAEFLSLYSPPIKCVIFNACHTDLQGQLISFGVPFTIGMNGAISDSAATEFTRGFYDAIGAGKDIELAFREGCICVKLTGIADKFMPVLFTEAQPQEQRAIKIISQHQIQFADEDEEGFLDYILDGTESFETVAEITGRITTGLNQLAEDMQQGTADMENLSNHQDSASVSKRKRIINHTARRIERFAQQLDEETPPFRDAYSKAIDYYGKAAILLTTEFDTDATGQIEEALGAVVGLKDVMAEAKSSLLQLRQSIAPWPRLTKKLNQAKRHCLTALDNFDREMGTGLQLTLKVETLMSNLLT